MSLETVHKKTCGSLKRQYSKLTDLNLLAEESIKVAVDQFEPAILPWQAGSASTRPQAPPKVYAKVCVNKRRY